MQNQQGPVHFDGWLFGPAGTVVDAIIKEEVDPSSSIWFVTLCAGGNCHCPLFHFHRLLWLLGGCPVWTGHYNRYFIATLVVGEGT